MMMMTCVVYEISYIFSLFFTYQLTADAEGELNPEFANSQLDPNSQLEVQQGQSSKTPIEKGKGCAQSPSK